MGCSAADTDSAMRTGADRDVQLSAEVGSGAISATKQPIRGSVIRSSRTVCGLARLMPLFPFDTSGA